MSPDDPSLAAITRQLDCLRVRYRTAATVREAGNIFTQADQPQVVVSGVTLTDGNWCDLFGRAVRSGLEAKLLVCCPDADERLWSEVIWRGGYDVLVEPYDITHVSWALGISQHYQETHSNSSHGGPVF